MKLIHTAISLFLALAIASPMCCCTAKACGSEVTSSCCGEPSNAPDSDDEQPTRVCSCKSKQVLDEAKATGLPAKPAIPIILQVEDLSELVQAVPKDTSLLNTPYSGCDPPRLLMAKLSRWLI